MKNILIIIFCLTSSSLFAQKPDFKALKQEVLNAQNDREKALAYVHLAAPLPTPQADLILQYADSIELLNNPQDSAFTKKVSEYLKAIGHFKAGNFRKAKDEFKQLVDQFENDSTEIQGKCLNFLGMAYIYIHHPDSAIITYQQLLDMADSSQVHLRTVAHGNMGRAFKAVGNYAQAIDNFEKTVELDTSMYSRLNGTLQIAAIFGDLMFYDKGIATLKKLDQSKLPREQITVAYFNNLGTLFYQDHQYDSATKYLQKGLSLGISENYLHLCIKNRITLAEIELERNQSDKAYELIKDAQKDADFLRNPRIQADVNLSFGSFFIDQNLPDSAIYYLRKIEKPESIRPDPNRPGCFQLLAKAYELKGDVEQSHQFLNNHIDWKEAHNISSSEKFLQDAKAKYLLAQKQKDLEKAQQESEFLNKTQRIILTVLVTVVIAILLLVFLLKKYREKLQSSEEEKDNLSKEIELSKSEILELKSKAVLLINDITSIKSDGHYLEFYLQSKEKPEIDRNRMKEVLEILPTSKFIQIHKSYIVNIDHIRAKYSNKVEMYDGRELPVSRTYKTDLNVAMAHRQS